MDNNTNISGAGGGPYYNPLTIQAAQPGGGGTTRNVPPTATTQAAAGTAVITPPVSSNPAKDLEELSKIADSFIAMETAGSNDRSDADNTSALSSLDENV